MQLFYILYLYLLSPVGHVSHGKAPYTYVEAMFAFYRCVGFRQEHCTQFQNQTDAILGHLNFPVRL